MTREKIAAIHSDAWVLCAILHADRGRGASLRDIIASADYLNHAILTFEETDGALGRLALGGHADLKRGQVHPSRAARSFYRQIGRPGNNMHNVLSRIRDYLGAGAPQGPLAQATGRSGSPGRRLDRAEFDRAVNAYLGSNRT
jgi:hypothetical protein